MGRLQKALASSQALSLLLLQNLTQVATLQPGALKVKHWDPAAQSWLRSHESPGLPKPAG